MYTSFFRKAMLGDTATLNLDFTTGVLDSRLTFTRAAGTATYINSSGYVATATTNAPRFDYSPTNIGEPRGLLIEGSAINLLKNSAYADTNWIAFGGYTKSITTGITSPANDTTAALLTFTAVGHGLYTNNTQMAYTNTVGATYTMSAWIRATSNTTNLNIRFGDSAVATGPNIPITTTWTRYSYSYVAASASGPLVQSASGTATGEFEMWGFQLELGSGASSYIPTGASQVTRNGDSCVMTGTNFSSWYTQGMGTVCWSGSAFRITAGHLANINTVNNDPRITAYVGAGSLTNLVTNGTTQASISFGTVTANTAFKAAWRFNTNDFAACLNAGTVYTDTLGTVPTGVDRMQLGAAEGGYQFLDGWIKSIKYYPTAFTNAQLQTATTL
jgi:hypothetical protein